MDSNQDIQQELNTFLSCLTGKSNEDLQKISNSLKELRALMRVYHNQEYLRKKFIEVDLRFFHTLEDLKNQSTDPELTKSILSFGLQLAVNCMVSNSANKEFIFKELMASDLEKLGSLLNSVFREPKLVKFFAMLMNSVVSDFEKEKVIGSWNILQYRFLIHKLLGFFFHEEYSGKEVEHQNDDSFEWFYYLISNILNLSNYLEYFQKEKSILKILWKVLDQYDFDPYADWDMADIEKHIEDRNKLRFLYFLHNAFEKTIGEKSQTSLIINYTPKNETIHELYDKKKEHGIAITIPDFMFIIEVFNHLSESVIQNIQSLTTSNFENLNEIKPKLNEILDYFHAILKLFCQISFLGGYNKIVQEKFFDNGSFGAALKTLQVVYQLDRKVEKEKPNNLKITDILHEDGYFELYLNFLRLTSNIVHINIKAQDYIYDNDYLLLLLSFTVVDQNNPYIREWSIILIKNLTENNPRIQEKIAQMKVVDFDSKTKELLKKFQYEPDPSLLK